jgi:hypothetical protein
VLCNPWNKKLRGSSGCCGNLEATLAVAWHAQQIKPWIQRTRCNDISQRS